MLVIAGAYDGGEAYYGFFTMFGGGGCRSKLVNHILGWTGRDSLRYA